jgi:hypothetical protein
VKVVLDKVENQIPYATSFQPDFRFVEKELRYAGFCSVVRPSRNYQGVIDLRPFDIDALLHLHYKRGGPRNHKLELLRSGEKSLEQMRGIIVKVFDVDPDKLKTMRLDFAADMRGVPVTYLQDSLRVKYKRTASVRGQLDYETVGGRKLEYFRYGKSPNCLRVYDKPAECKARMRELLKSANRDAEPPTYEELFGFPENTIMARVERQAGGGKIPEQLATFGQLRNAAEFDPFTNLEILPRDFPYPNPQLHGVARSVKLMGIHNLIERHGYQQARAMLNCEGNVKRMMDDYQDYLLESKSLTELSVGSIIDSYQRSTRKQIDGTVETPTRNDPLTGVRT